MHSKTGVNVCVIMVGLVCVLYSWRSECNKVEVIACCVGKVGVIVHLI